MDANTRNVGGSTAESPDESARFVVILLAARYSEDVSGVFLTAEWRDLLMLNYEVEGSLLQKLVPSGTELDRWQERVFLSLVGFRFLNARVFGLSIPFHRNFEEANLRFYVRREKENEVKRGVVFIREVVPRWAVATVARSFYNENYVALPMVHCIDGKPLSRTAEYSWKSREGWNRMWGRAHGEPAFPGPGSQEEFIAEHYWGYAAQRDGGCVEYRVAHPRWRVWKAQDAAFEGNVEEIYGSEFMTLLGTKPTSAFLAEGSEVSLYRGRRLQGYGQP